MNNDITINVEELLLVPDYSITDAETIRQIGLYSLLQNGSARLVENAKILTKKIKPSCMFAALYPHAQQSHDISPDTFKPESRSILEELHKKRKSYKTAYDYVNDPNVYNIYIFGSQVYGTATPESDTDIIMVVKDWFDSKDVNIHVYTVAQFELLLERQDIQALECLFAHEEFVLKCNIRRWNTLFQLNKQLLRIAISTITSNSWVKGKKKLTVSGDYDLHLAIKSTFHSLRILDFGIQIATSGTIENYGSMNFVLEDLKKLSNEYQREELWNKIDDKYRKLFNAKTTMFKLLAPKDLTEKNSKVQLEKIIRKYIPNFDPNRKTSIEMIDEILNLFQK